MAMDATGAPLPLGKGRGEGGTQAAHSDPPPDRPLSVVGRSLPRVDAWEKVTGQARYSADLLPPGVLFGRVLRSPHPHAEIVRLDTSAAEALPGVRAVVTYRHAPPRPFEGEDGPAPVFLLDRVVRHVGDEVAVVAAVSDEVAEGALGLIEVEYRPLPFVLEAEAALAPGAPSVRGGPNLARGAPIVLARGDVEHGLAEAELVVEATYRTQATSPCALEPRCAVAWWEGGRLTVWKASRNVYGDRERLAAVFGLPLNRVWVIGATVGGSFGQKDETRLDALAALAARQAGRPVRLLYSREEELAAGRWRHATATRVCMGVRRDGSLTAIESASALNTGPYSPGFGVARRLGHGLTYLYTCPNVRYEGRVAFTNSPVAGSYRGLGAPQGHFALESLVDEVAERLGLDPLEFRLRNGVPPAGQPGAPRPAGQGLVPPQPVEGGLPFSSNYLRECLEEGARRIGWTPRPGGPRRLVVDGRLRGMGVACCIYQTGQARASAIVKLNADGSADLLMATMDVGQGSATVLTQIAAEALGLRYEEVRGHFGDTGSAPFSHGTSGSTATFTSGLAAQRAALDARRQLLAAAAGLLEVQPGDLEVREGVVFVRGAPEVRLTVREVAERRGGDMIIGQASVRAGSPTHIVNAFAAHFAEVEVDPETGAVRVLRYVAVHDSGRALNPEAARGQIVGGVVQGLGYALLEELRVDPASGAPGPLNLHEFKVPTVVDVAAIEAVLLDRPDPIGPYGAKALGEPPLVPVAAAVANAVYDATGVRLRELPLTAEKVRRGLG